MAPEYSAGVEALPTFPYFRDPVGEGVLKPGDGVCAACGRARGWVYLDYGRFLCPWCIADGTAAAKFDCSFNDASYFGAPVGTVPRLPLGDEREVEQRTPGFNTWQGNHWVQCCGRACVYLGEASAEDLAGRWAAAVPSITEYVPGWSEEDKAELIRTITKGRGPCAYAFECRVCGGLRGYWDIH